MLFLNSKTVRASHGRVSSENKREGDQEIHFDTDKTFTSTSCIFSKVD